MRKTEKRMLSFLLALMMTLTLAAPAYAGDVCAHEYTVTERTEPGCAEQGSEVYTCALCGDSYTVTLEAGHTPNEPVTENAAAPTCTAAGNHDAVVYCAVCGAELSRETVVDEALGHDWDGDVCTRCGEERSTVPGLKQQAQAAALQGSGAAYSPGPGRYYIRVTPQGQGSADYFDMYLKVFNADGELIGSYAESYYGDQWETKKITADLAAAPATITITTSYQRSGDQSPFTLEYTASFEAFCSDRVASDRPLGEETAIDFCHYSIEYVQGAEGDPLPPLQYVDENGYPHQQETYKIFRGRLDDDQTEEQTLWFALRENYDIHQSIMVDGDVNLVLCDDTTLTCEGLFVGPGDSLTIWQQSGGSGALNAQAGNGLYNYGEPGIEVYNGAALTINDGYVVGIGGSYEFDCFNGKDPITDKNFDKFVANITLKGKVSVDNIFGSVILSLFFSDDYSGAGIGGGNQGNGGTNECSAVGWGHDSDKTAALSIYPGAKVSYGNYQGDDIRTEGVTNGSDKVNRAKNNAYAKIEPGELTVSFDTGEVSVVSPTPQQCLTAGEKAEKPTDPVAAASEDKLFDIWYADENRTTTFDFDQPITQNTTVYGSWVTEYPLHIRIAWPESETPPAAVVLPYTNRYAQGRTKEGALTLTAAGNWQGVLYATLESVLSLNESPAGGFVPLGWTLGFGSIEEALTMDAAGGTALDIAALMSQYNGFANAFPGGSAYVRLDNALRCEVCQDWDYIRPQSYTSGGVSMSFDWIDVIGQVEVVMQRKTASGAWETVDRMSLSEWDGDDRIDWRKSFSTRVSGRETVRIREIITNTGREGPDGFVLPEGVTEQILYAETDEDGPGERPSFLFRHDTQDGQSFTGLFYLDYRRGEDGSFIIGCQKGTLLSAKMQWEGEESGMLKPETIAVVLQHAQTSEGAAEATWETVETRTLSADNGWKTVFTRVRADGENLRTAYRVRELGQDGSIAYADSDPDKPASGSDSAAFTVTDAQGAAHELLYTVGYGADTDGLTTVTNRGRVYAVQLVWDVPSGATVPYSVPVRSERLVDGVLVQAGSDSITAGQSGQWKCAFGPVWESGEYRVRQTDDGGQVLHDLDDADGDGSVPIYRTYRYVNDCCVALAFAVAYQENGTELVITETPRGPFSASMAWAVDPEGALKPESVTVALMHWYALGEPQGAGWTILETAELSEANGWRADFDTIPDEYNLAFY